MRVWWVVPWDRKVRLRMYRSSELSRTKNDPSTLSVNFASASSQFSGPQYQPHCKHKTERHVEINPPPPHMGNVSNESALSSITHAPLASRAEMLTTTQKLKDNYSKTFSTSVRTNAASCGSPTQSLKDTLPGWDQSFDRSLHAYIQNRDYEVSAVTLSPDGTACRITSTNQRHSNQHCLACLVDLLSICQHNCQLSCTSTETRGGALNVTVSQQRFNASCTFK